MTSFSMVISCWGCTQGYWPGGEPAGPPAPPPRPHSEQVQLASTFRLRLAAMPSSTLAEDLHQLGALTAHAVKGADLMRLSSTRRFRSWSDMRSQSP